MRPTISMLDVDLLGPLMRTATLALSSHVPARLRDLTGEAGTVAATAWLLKAAVLPVVVAPAIGIRRWPRLTVPASLLGLALLAWILAHPTTHVHQLVSRGDHLLMAALLGASMARAPLALRTTVLTVVSLTLLVAHFGWRPVVITGASAGLAWAALQPAALRGVSATVATQAGALGLGGAGLLFVREHNFFAALLAQGIFAYVLLRQVSFAVEVRRGRSGSLRDWACYQSFYLSCFASQVYDEFHDWNLAARSAFAPRDVVRGLAGGALLMAAAALVPLTFADVLATTPPASLWAASLGLYVRSTLGLMGFWAILEAIALLYDIRLRPNWPRTILATNPAQFWRAWRATMTWWLIRYVYVPLGGNRRHHLRNIAAAFGVSLLWHWWGIPFLDTPVHARDYLPIAAWAVVNATGVAGWALWRRRHPAPTRRPLWRVALAMLLTALFGSFTVTFLAFEPRTAAQFPDFARRLVGL